MRVNRLNFGLVKLIFYFIPRIFGIWIEFSTELYANCYRVNKTMDSNKQIFAMIFMAMRKIIAIQFEFT